MMFKNAEPPDDGKKRTQILAVLTVSISLLISGMHGGWSGPSLRKVLSVEFPFDVTEEEASYIAISGPAGDIIGGILGSILIDKIGRKWTILSLAIPQSINFLSLYFSYYVKELLYVGRTFGGIGEGASLVIIPLYIAEVTEPKVRGMLGTVIGLMFLMGKLFINILGSYVDIHNTALICFAFTAIFVVSFLQMPETPYYLLIKKREKEAEDCLRYLHRKSNVTKEVVRMTVDIQRQMSESGKYSDIFKIQSNRKAFFIVIGLRFFQQFTGCTAFSFYIQILLEDATDFSPVIGSSMVILVQLSANMAAMFVIDKFGRKPLFIFSISTCFLTLLPLATFFAIRDYNLYNVTHFTWIPLVLMLVYTMGFQFGLGVGTNLVTSEVLSASIKSKALSLSSVSFALLIICTTKFYQFTADNFGMAVPLYSFAVVTGVGILFCIFILPETKGKSLEDIQQELKGNRYNHNAPRISIPDC